MTKGQILNLYKKAKHQKRQRKQVNGRFSKFELAPTGLNETNEFHPFKDETGQIELNEKLMD